MAPKPRMRQRQLVKVLLLHQRLRAMDVNRTASAAATNSE